LEELKNYIGNENNKLADYDWWYFSKIDEAIDDIGIPYFSFESGEYRNFFPDFIFWLKKGDKYYIKFIDPHGAEQGRDNSVEKIDGFNEFIKDFNNLKNKKLEKIEIYFFNKRTPGVGMGEEYRKYWTNDFDNIFK
jgi:hypothetical protein